jgi:hypothetical protein
MTSPALSRYGRHYQKALMVMANPDPPAPRLYSRRRRSVYKKMCDECLQGKHQTCELRQCSCLHRGNKAHD